MQRPPPSHLLRPDLDGQAVRVVVLVYRCPDGQPGEGDEVENVEKHVDHQNLGDGLEKSRVTRCYNLVFSPHQPLEVKEGLSEGMGQQTLPPI